MDKYVVGLLDAFQFSGVEAKHLLPITIEPYDETDVISENLFQVANIIGDDKYRKPAVRSMATGWSERFTTASWRHACYVALNPWDGSGEQSMKLPGSLSPLSASGQLYRTVVAGRDVVFVPYFTVDTERYTTCFRIS